MNLASRGSRPATIKNFKMLVPTNHQKTSVSRYLIPEREWSSSLLGPLMVHHVVVCRTDCPCNKICKEDRRDWSIEHDENGVVDDECAHSHDGPAEHAPIKMPLEKCSHGLKLSVSPLSTQKRFNASSPL